MSVLDQYTGSAEDPTTISSVKNKALATATGNALNDYNTARTAGNSALGDYISKYMSGTPAAATRTGGEISNIDRYFNGGAASELAGLRAQRSSAVNNAADLASQYALANLSRSRAMGDGGPSSFDTRLALRNQGDIRTQAAVDNASQARSDWDYLDRNRLALTGQRTNLADTLAGRALVPAAAQRNVLGQDLGLLGQIGQIDQANTFYGLKNHPGIGEGFASDYGQLTSAY